MFVGDSMHSVDSCLVELECSSINMNVELRPRSGGFKIGLCVEDLYLRDKMTTGSLCPSLIEPVKKVITSRLIYIFMYRLMLCRQMLYGIDGYCFSVVK